MTKNNAMPLTLPTIISLSRLAEPAGPDVFNALARDLLNDEGGSALTNRATDKGGQTRFGISKRSHPDVDVVNLTRDGALAIYRAKYFDTARVAELPTVLAKMVFDGAVNHGVPSAGFMLQSAYNQLIQDLDIAGADPLKADGVTGDKTIAAIAALDPVQILALTTLFCSQRMIRYGSDATWSANGHGWSRRLWLNTFQSLMQGATAPAEAASV